MQHLLNLTQGSCSVKYLPGDRPGTWKPWFMPSAQTVGGTAHGKIPNEPYGNFLYNLDMVKYT